MNHLQGEEYNLQLGMLSPQSHPNQDFSRYLRMSWASNNRRVVSIAVHDESWPDAQNQTLWLGTQPRPELLGNKHNCIYWKIKICM